MHISFAWWNTSLSPVGKQRAKEEERQVALEIVRYLTKSIRVDCLALGEITAEDLEFLHTGIGLDDYSIHDGTLKTGLLQFDTGVFYQKNVLELLGYGYLESRRGPRSLKVANRLDFQPSEGETLFHLFVSHWPSRVWCEKNGADRHILGVRLRDAVEELNLFYGGPTPYVVLLGDYNEEPYDESLAEQLLASRDRRLAIKNPQFLYNPFWRHLGENFPHVPGSPPRGYGGSCFYSSGLETKWRTFDQIIFSSAFLHGQEWELKEEHTKILQLEPLNNFICSRKTIFDHFPVISIIERGEKK